MYSGRPIIPDRILESNICELCDNYLTVRPITIHSNGGNICGRCSLNNENKSSPPFFECDSTTMNTLEKTLSIPYTILGYSNHVFPCINRFEGCNKLLTFENISNHEPSCQSFKQKCGYCSNYEGTGTQLINHFKKRHPSNFFETTNFPIPHEKYTTNLIKWKRNLFILDIGIDVDRSEIMFHARSTNWLKHHTEFFCLLKDATGEIIDQSIVSRPERDGTSHFINIKDVSLLQKKTFSIYCECLFKILTL